MAGTQMLRTRSDLARHLQSRGIAFETVQDGPRWAIVTPTLGARILGAGVDEENAFWVSPAEQPASGWFNAGGQRTWLAPEGGRSGIFCGMDLAAWTVPPALDPGQYRPYPGAGPHAWRTELEVRAADGIRHRVALTRSLELQRHASVPGAMVIRFRHGLANLDQALLDRRVGLWGLIQLPCEDGGGAAFLSLRRSGALLSPYFGDIPGIITGDDGSVAWLGMKGGARFKAGMTAAGFSGTVGFIRRSRVAERGGELLLTAMSFRVEPAETYVDRSPLSWSAGGDGDAVQVYQDPGTGPLAFCEIEAHALAPRLAPGEAAAQDIAITVASLEEREAAGFLHRELGVAPFIPLQ